MKEQRKIDSLRRIVIPADFFKELNFSKYQIVEISMRYGKICISKFQKKNFAKKPFIGIIRKLDSVNRVVIPPEYLELLELHPCDTIDLELESNSIIIKK